MLFLAVLRTSRHPQSASMLLQGLADPSAVESASMLLPTLWDTL